jgi:hypothetical protein
LETPLGKGVVITLSGRRSPFNNRRPRDQSRNVNRRRMARAGNLPTRDKTRRIAANIAKPPVVFYIRGMEITLDLP